MSPFAMSSQPCQMPILAAVSALAGPSCRRAARAV
jgi:hypothetical protein